ncbi:MAG: hypothetical protein R2688_10650 [Fimbriimonadaceae bacterium]
MSDQAQIIHSIEAYQSRLLRAIHDKLLPCLGSTYSNSICALLDVISIPYESPPIVCQLMQIYGAIGESTMVHQILMAHEEYVEIEFGEPASKKVIETYERALCQSMSERSVPCTPIVPHKNSFSVGFHDAVQRLTDQILTRPDGRSYCVHGPSGSGKTHFLIDLYYALSNKANVMFVDLEDGLGKKPSLMGLTEPPDVLIVDNICIDNLNDLRVLTKIISPTYVVFSSYRTDELFQSTNIQIPILSSGNRIDFGPALQLFEHHYSSDFHMLPRRHQAQVDEYICSYNNSPAAIISLAKQCQTLGVDSALRSIKASDFSLHNSARNTTSHRMPVTVGDFELTNSHIRVCQCILRSGNRLLPGMIGQLPEVPHQIVSDLLEGRVLCESMSGTISVSGSYEYLLKSDYRYQTEPNVWQNHFRDIALWVNRRSDFPEDEPQLYENLSVLWETCSWHLQDTNREQAIQLFIAASAWFGYCPVPKSIISQFTAILNSETIESSNAWGQLAIAIGRAHFSNGHYSEMSSIYEKAIVSTHFGLISPEHKSNLAVIGAISASWLGNYAFAKKILLDMAAVPKDNVAQVKLFFNLGCINERSGDLAGALKSYESAFEYYGEGVDSRLMAFNSISALRSRYQLFGHSKETAQKCRHLLQDKEIMRGNEIRSMVMCDTGIMKMNSGLYGEAIWLICLGLMYLFSVSTNGEVVERAEYYLRSLKESLIALHDEEWIVPLTSLHDCVKLLLSATEDQAYDDIDYVKSLISEICVELIRSHGISSLPDLKSLQFLQDECPLISYGSRLETSIHVTIHKFLGHCRKYSRRAGSFPLPRLIDNSIPSS